MVWVWVVFMVITPKSRYSVRIHQERIFPKVDSMTTTVIEQQPKPEAGKMVETVPHSPVEQPKFGLSFSGCGFLGTYHFGSVACFQKHGKKILARTTKVAGASAGSLVAALLVLCPQRLDAALEIMYSLADEVNSLKFGALTPGFSLIEKLEGLVDTTIPENAGELASEILHVSCTKIADRSNLLQSRFGSRDLLIKHLMASCYIPVYAGAKQTPPLIDDQEYADGGLSDNLPKLEEVRTITVSPFSGEAAISPFDDTTPLSVFDWTMTLGNQLMKVNMKNVVRGAQALFPPKKEVLEGYYDMGYRDTMKFLLQEQLFERIEGTEV